MLLSLENPHSSLRRPFVSPLIVGRPADFWTIFESKSLGKLFTLPRGKSAQECGLTGFCFFAGIPKFLTITTSLLGAPA
jgi:hypothetical protein